MAQGTRASGDTALILSILGDGGGAKAISVVKALLAAGVNTDAQAKVRCVLSGEVKQRGHLVRPLGEVTL